MFKISFSDGLGLVGIIATVVLVAADKAGKLKGPLPVVLLAIAALMTLPLALGNSWVAETTPGMLRFSKGMLMIFSVGVVYSLLLIWISPTTSPDQVGSETEAGKNVASIALPVLFLECSRISLPVVLRADSPIYSLDAYAPSGDFRINSVAGGEAPWPYIVNEGQYGYKCDLTNFGDDPVFAVSVVFTLSRLETKKHDNGGLQSGKVIESVNQPVSMPKIDPHNGRFTFYVWTSGDSFVQLVAPDVVTLELAGSPNKVQVKLKQPTGPGSTFLVLTPRINPGQSPRETIDSRIIE
jgi:hypothetical protein